MSSSSARRPGRGSPSPSPAVTVIGAGCWGYALADVLTGGEARAVTLASPTGERLAALARGEHPRFPGHRLPAAVRVTADLPAAARGADVILIAVSSPYLADLACRLAPLLAPGAILVSAVKGLSPDRAETPSQTLARLLPGRPVAALSGPSHAEEVIRGLPFGLQLASRSRRARAMAERLFRGTTALLVPTADLLGLEIAAALKNVIAIGYGICRGGGLGSNFSSLFVTQAWAETRRLLVAAGGRAATSYGLGGLGDLLTTIGSPHSRNTSFGELLGRGLSPESALREVGYVVEGANTCDGAMRLSARLGLSLPALELVAKVIRGRYRAEDLAAALLAVRPTARR